MQIIVKNKDTLLCDDFKFKCCVGKKGIRKRKKEGDYSTPKGTYSLGKLYYRSDRIAKPVSKLSKKVIKKSLPISTLEKSKSFPIYKSWLPMKGP